MGWTDIAGAVLVLVVLGCIIWIMVRPARPSADVSPTSGVGALLGGAFLQGLLAAVALGAGLQNAAQGAVSPWLAGVTCGAAVGFLFAVMSGTGALRETVIGVTSGILGVVGIFVTVSEYFDASGACTQADIGQRILGVLLIAVAVALGGAMSWFRHLFSPKTLGAIILAIFGVLQVVEFLSSPFGQSVVDLGVTGWLVALVAAFALGFAASIWPALVIAVAGIIVAASSIIGTVSGSANALCLPGTDVAGLAPLIGYVAVYFGMRLVGRRFLSPSMTGKSGA